MPLKHHDIRHFMWIPLAEHHQLFSNLSMAALQQALATTTQELLCRGNASTVLQYPRHQWEL
jgi:hypothetical protein